VRRATVLDQEEFIIRVKNITSPQQVAQTIRVAIFNEHRMPIIRAIGVQAVAQACKGIAIARGHVATQGFDLCCTIGFADVTGDDGQQISAQSFHLFVR
jgi:stage V sporulation protein SpoVS